MTPDEQHLKYSISCYYSPHERGWYAQLWLTHTGEEKFTTPVYQSRVEAISAAKRFADALEESEPS